MAMLSTKFILQRFVSVMLFPNLMTMQAKWIYHTFTQRIRIVKTFIEKKKYHCWSIYHKKHKKQCRMLRFLWQNKTAKSKVPSINYPYFTKLFKFFVIKFKLLRKSIDSLILGVTNVTLVCPSCVQTA